MRGKKKLLLGIAVVSTTGMLVFTAPFPQPQIMQTEGTFQNGTAGIMTEAIPEEQLDEILAQAVTVEKNDIITVAASASKEEQAANVSKKKASKKQEANTKAKKKLENTSEEKKAVVKGTDTEAEGSEKNSDEKAKVSASNKKSSNPKATENASDRSGVAANSKSSASNKKVTKANSKNSSSDEEASKASSKSSSSDKNGSDTKVEIKTKSNTSDKSSSDKQVEGEAKSTSDKDSSDAKVKNASDKNKSDKEVKISSASSAKADTSEKNTDKKKKTADKETDAEQEEKQQAAEEKKWENKLMADVDDYLNIRKSANAQSEVVGKLRKGDVATIIKKGKNWTEIKSGSVKGFVKNKYCVYGTKAYKLANRICGTYAIVQADGLRIRKNANKQATILEAAEEGDKLEVNTKAKDKDGWVTVKYNDQNAFVSEKYVDVALVTGKALSIEEEQKQIAEQQKAEAAAQAAQASSVSASSGNVTVQNEAAQVSTSDLTLLSAIIFCEAGGESYAGQVAVGAVVMNRVRSGSYPNSISGVVYQSGQFSPVANGALARALSNGSYRNCISAAQEALAGADNTGGAKFFHRVNGDAGLVIGNHVFY